MGTHQFEHRKKKSKRERIRYAYYDSFGIPVQAYAYESRVKADGGTIEGFICLGTKLGGLQ